MKSYLKKFGVWEIVINPLTPSNKKGKGAAWKEAKKDNAIALKFLMDGLPSSVKESVGKYTSAKDLWFKLESEYRKGRLDTEKTDHELEVKPTEQVKQKEEKQEVDSSKGMDAFDCNDNMCDEIEKVLAEDDEGYQRLHIRYISHC